MPCQCLFDPEERLEIYVRSRRSNQEEARMKNMNITLCSSYMSLKTETCHRSPHKQIEL